MRFPYFLPALFLLFIDPIYAQRPDTTLIRYAGQLTGQYTSGGLNLMLSLEFDENPI